MKQQQLAAFDFDGTITLRDSFLDFLIKSRGRGKVAWGLLLHIPLICLYKLGFISNEKAKERLFSYFFKGLHQEKFLGLCEYYGERIPEIVNPEALACVRQHLSCGREVVIVTASVEDWIRPWALQVGIREVIGTRIEIGSDGRLTGKFSTPNCYGAEKVKRLRSAYPLRDTYLLYAYGDSRGDRELLEFADYAYWREFPCL